MGFMCPGCGCGVATCAGCTSLPPLKLTDSLYGGPINQRSTPIGGDNVSFDATISITGYQDSNLLPSNCHITGLHTVSLPVSYGLICNNDGTYSLIIRFWTCSTPSYPWTNPDVVAPFAHTSPIWATSDPISGPFDCANPSLAFTFTNWSTASGHSTYPHGSGGAVTVVKQ